MATIRILLGIFCLAAFGWSGLPGGGFVGRAGFGAGNLESAVASKQWPAFSEAYRKATPSHLISRKIAPYVTNTIIAIAKSQIGVREATGKNDGLNVAQYLAYTGEQKGAPWCAAFVSWVFGRTGFGQPKTAWSPALFPLQKRTADIQPATVFGIYFPDLKRIAHCGFVERLEGHWIITIEGNTNVAGSREGDGVYRKRRLLNTVKYFADWTKGKEEAKHEKF